MRQFYEHLSDSNIEAPISEESSESRFVTEKERGSKIAIANISKQFNLKKWTNMANIT